MSIQEPTEFQWRLSDILYYSGELTEQEQCAADAMSGYKRPGTEAPQSTLYETLARLVGNPALNWYAGAYIGMGLMGLARGMADEIMGQMRSTAPNNGAKENKNG